VRTSVEDFSELLRRAGIRRLLGLVSSAWRAKKAAVGATAVEEVLAKDGNCLVVVARDAHTAASGYGVARAVALGRALAASTKSDLGGVLGRAEVGVVAILDQKFEAPLREAALLAELSVPRSHSRREQPAEETR
jgi:ribosomal protein L7Ae-like RNA K-turn-binding protein